MTEWIISFRPLNHNKIRQRFTIRQGNVLLEALTGGAWPNSCERFFGGLSPHIFLYS